MPKDKTHKSIDLTFYARILIATAIALLAYGFYLDVESEVRLIDPVKGVTQSTKKDENYVSIDIRNWDDGLNDDVDPEPGDEDPDSFLGPISSNKPSSSSGGWSSGGFSSKPSAGSSGVRPPSEASSGNSGSGSSSGGSGSGVGSGAHASSGGSSSGNTGSSGGSSGSSGSSGGGSSSSGGSGGSSSGGGSGSTTPTTPAGPSLSETNNNLRNTIQNNYGITIRYGSETNGYSVGGLRTNPITDDGSIQTTLNKLNAALSLYPNGFFREIKNGGIPLTLYLVNSFSEYGVTGVTDSNYSSATISVAIVYPFEETFYHESYHYIERYMFKKGIYFHSWDSYNPPGFSYGSLLRDQSYSRTGSASAYFVNDYAQSSADEDRASTFEYMMSGSKPACLNHGQHVWTKAQNMANAIDSALNTVSPGVTEYWERHL